MESEHIWKRKLLQLWLLTFHLSQAMANESNKSDVRQINSNHSRTVYLNSTTLSHIDLYMMLHPTIDNDKHIFQRDNTLTLRKLERSINNFLTLWMHNTTDLERKEMGMMSPWDAFKISVMGFSFVPDITFDTKHTILSTLSNEDRNQYYKNNSHPLPPILSSQIKIKMIYEENLSLPVKKDADEKVWMALSDSASRQILTHMIQSTNDFVLNQIYSLHLTKLIINSTHISQPPPIDLSYFDPDVPMDMNEPLDDQNTKTDHNDTTEIQINHDKVINHTQNINTNSTTNKNDDTIDTNSNSSNDSNDRNDTNNNIGIIVSNPNANNLNNTIQIETTSSDDINQKITIGNSSKNNESNLDQTFLLSAYIAIPAIILISVLVIYTHRHLRRSNHDSVKCKHLRRFDAEQRQEHPPRDVALHEQDDHRVIIPYTYRDTTTTTMPLPSHFQSFHDLTISVSNIDHFDDVGHMSSITSSGESSRSTTTS